LPDQFALFADAPALPDGLRYAADFIPEAVERDLIAHVAALPLQPFQFGQYEGKVHDLVLYAIDNEIHHRGQGYVYLRALGIEPPPFYERA